MNVDTLIFNYALYSYYSYIGINSVVGQDWAVVYTEYFLKFTTKAISL